MLQEKKSQLQFWLPSVQKWVCHALSSLVGRIAGSDLLQKHQKMGKQFFV